MRETSMPQPEMDLHLKPEPKDRWALYVEGTVRGQETMVLLTNGNGNTRLFDTWEEAKSEQREHDLSVVVPEGDLL
jgi:hypothetical protein